MPAKSCVLDSDMSNNKDAVFASGIMASPKICSLDNFPATPCVETGYWYGENYLKNINNVSDAKSCHKECESVANCQFWIYQTENTAVQQDKNKRCWLKTAKDESKKIAIPGIISSHKTCPSNNPSSDSCFEKGYNYAGDELKNYPNIEDSKSCQKKCQDEPQDGTLWLECKFWVYFDSTFDKGKLPMTLPDPKSCWLKSTKPGSTESQMTKSDLISGITAGPKECGSKSEENSVFNSTLYSSPGWEIEIIE